MFQTSYKKSLLNNHDTAFKVNCRSYNEYTSHMNTILLQYNICFFKTKKKFNENFTLWLVIVEF